MSVAWNQPWLWWEYLQHRNWQVLKIIDHIFGLANRPLVKASSFFPLNNLGRVQGTVFMRFRFLWVQKDFSCHFIIWILQQLVKFVWQVLLSFLHKGWPTLGDITQWMKSEMGTERHNWCFLYLKMPMEFTEFPWAHRIGEIQQIQFQRQTQISEGNESLFLYNLVLK